LVAFQFLSNDTNGVGSPACGSVAKYTVTNGLVVLLSWNSNSRS
jgi:hypothetical protein